MVHNTAIIHIVHRGSGAKFWGVSYLADAIDENMEPPTLYIAMDYTLPKQKKLKYIFQAEGTFILLKSCSQRKSRIFV